MKEITLFGRKPAPLLISAVLACCCVAGYYQAYQANASLRPVLPPLAAQRHLQQWLYNPAPLRQQIEFSNLELITEVYQNNDYQPLWLDDYGLSAAGQALLQQLLETSADNVIHYPYHLNYIRQRLQFLGARPDDATALDIVLTDAFIAYAEDVLSGTLELQKLLQQQSALQPVTLTTNEYHQQILQLLSQTNHSDRHQLLQAMAPGHDSYQQMREALRQYQAIADSGIWQPFADGPTLQVGDEHRQAGQLRKLLRAYGDYPRDIRDHHSQNHNLFDKTLAESLARFQARHGKPSTGKLDKTTRQLLNIAPALRIKQIALNMKRWRELPADLGDRYIWVNVADFQLQLIENNETTLAMKVIVGKTSRRTPILQESINSIVLNPPWNVPQRIMVQDILPKAKQDPEYLLKKNIRILQGWEDAVEIPYEAVDLTSIPLRRFPYRLQQAPGQDNALGMVKFVIPNDESIYLHDTNQPELFANDFRALSSGCIRVEKPLELAMALLQGEGGWSNAQIQQLLAAGKTRHLRLPESIPTYLSYRTSWVDAEGRVHFRDDIYQQDTVITAQFDKSRLL